MPLYRCYKNGTEIHDGDWCATCYWQNKYRHLEGTTIKPSKVIVKDVGKFSCPCDTHGAEKTCYWRAKYMELDTKEIKWK